MNIWNWLFGIKEEEAPKSKYITAYASSAPVVRRHAPLREDRNERVVHHDGNMGMLGPPGLLYLAGQPSQDTPHHTTVDTTPAYDNSPKTTDYTPSYDSSPSYDSGSSYDSGGSAGSADTGASS